MPWPLWSTCRETLCSRECRPCSILLLLTPSLSSSSSCETRPYLLSSSYPSYPSPKPTSDSSFDLLTVETIREVLLTVIHSSSHTAVCIRSSHHQHHKICGYYSQLHTLQAVCRLWFTTIKGLPSLWTHLHLGFPIHAIQHILRESRGLPLDVIRDTLTDPDSTVQTTLDTASRWRRIDIYAASILPSDLSLPCTSLQRIRIFHLPPYASPTHQYPYLFGGRMTSPTEIELRRTWIPIETLNLSSLDSLCLESVNAPMDGMRQVLDMASRTLRRLLVHFPPPYASTDNPHHPGSTFAPILLPRLQTLDIAVGINYTHLLPLGISTPALDSFTCLIGGDNVVVVDRVANWAVPVAHRWRGPRLEIRLQPHCLDIVGPYTLSVRGPKASDSFYSIMARIPSSTLSPVTQLLWTSSSNPKAMEHLWQLAVYCPRIHTIELQLRQTGLEDVLEQSTSFHELSQIRVWLRLDPDLQRLPRGWHLDVRSQDSTIPFLHYQLPPWRSESFYDLDPP